jgi:hypothetical protein
MVMKFKLTLCFVLFLVFNVMKAQTISGYVFDETTNKPLEGAFVYLDGTTYSADTDASGAFTLSVPQKITAFLVVRYLGYETLRLEDAFSYKSKIKMLLRPDSINLDEVVINKSTVFSRKDMLKVFREQFLGKTKAGKSCKILNEDDIVLNFDVSTNVLSATASNPLHIINERLEYDLLFDLMEFQVKFNGKTLSDNYLRQSFYAGTTFFTDISDGKSVNDKRDKSYLGSPVHFLSALANKNLEKQGYQLFAKGFEISQDNYMIVTDTADVKKVTLLELAEEERPQIKGINLPKAAMLKSVRYEVLYKNDQSFFIFKEGELYIDKSGLFWPINELSFGGHMSGLKVGDMLPADYKYSK